MAGSDGDSSNLPMWLGIILFLAIFWGLMCGVVPGVSDMTFAIIAALAEWFNV